MSAVFVSALESMHYPILKKTVLPGTTSFSLCARALPLLLVLVTFGGSHTLHKPMVEVIKRVIFEKKTLILITITVLFLRAHIFVYLGSKKFHKNFFQLYIFSKLSIVT